MKRLVAAPMKVCKRANMSHLRVISQCSLSQMKCEAVNNPSLTSGALFRSPGEATISRSTYCYLWKKVGSSVRPMRKPQLIKVHTNAFEMGKGEHEGLFLKNSVHR